MSHKTVFIEMIPALDSGFFFFLFDMNSLIGVVNFCRYVFMSALSGAQHIFVGQNYSEVNHSL
jgi:hypothetical protein